MPATSNVAPELLIAQTRPRVALCLPSKGDCKSGFTYDLARLAYASANAGIELTFARGIGTLVQDVRIDVAQKAMSHLPDYLLWLDDDMRFPHDALARLLAHKAPIVGCNYPSRSKGNPQPTARRMDGPNKWHLVHTTPLSQGTEEVDALGFGCVLIASDVFRALEAPWFSIPWSPDMQKHVGEDVFFCVNAAIKGFPTLLDHDLSKELRHVGSYEYEWSDINRTRG